MRLLSSFVFASGLLGLVQCASLLDTRVSKNLAPSEDEWEMQPAGSSERDLVWVASHQYGELDEIEHLYIEASKGFNWVKKQENCLTSDGNLLVAAYYDQETQKVYLSTIPRGSWEDNISAYKNHYAPIWSAHYDHVRKRDMHAEDGAYFWREYEDSINPGPYAILDVRYGYNDKHGSKVAVWGTHGSSKSKIHKSKGKPVKQCDKCKSLADSLGVYTSKPK